MAQRPAIVAPTSCSDRQGRKKKSRFPQVRHLALIDAVGVHNDEAFPCLPENLRKPDGGQCLAAEHIPEGEARPYRGQLVRVAHQDQSLSRRDGVEQLA